MTQFIAITCYRCKVTFGLNQEFYNIAKQRGESMGWYCPNGHEQVFSTGPTEEEKLRKERDRLKQDATRLIEKAADAERARQSAERRTAAARGQITKLKKRASAGVCPCCNRTFTDLQRHMAGQHPTFISEPDASEHVH